MVFVLIVLGFVFWIGYLVGKSSTSKPSISSNISQLQTVYDIANTILSSKKKLDKDTLIALYAIQYVTSTTMTFDVALQQARAYVDSLDQPNSAKSKTSSETVATQTVQATSSQVHQKNYAVQVQESSTSTHVDTTSQLLYFGAFLLVTSIGLFVGFAEVEGGLKVFLLTLVAAILYASGDYLSLKTKSLQSVGATFIAVALLAIPFIGLASHIYLLDQQYPEMVWFITSLVSFALYLYSLDRYKQAFTGYMLIGSSVSSLLSIVGILALPAHVFFWTLIATGLLLKLFASKNSSQVLITKPAEQFANVLVPLALFSSLISIGNLDGSEGSLLLVDTGQFAVSLALASLYAYVGHRTSSDKHTASLYGDAVHPLGVSALAVGVFSYDASIIQTGLALQLLTVLYICNNFVNKHTIRSSYEPTVIIVALLGAAFTSSYSTYVTLGIIGSLFLTISLTFRTKEAAYTTTSAALLIVLSYVVGQYLISPGIDLTDQLYFSGGATLLLLVVSLYLRLKMFVNSSLYAQQVEAVAAISVGVTTFLSLLSQSEMVVALHGVLWFALLLIYWLARKRLHGAKENQNELHLWFGLSYAILYISQVAILLMGSNSSFSYDISAALAALLATICGALLTRASWIRWASAIQWLILPLIFASTGTFHASFSLPSISIMYAGVAFFLMGSRLIALGRVQESFSKKSIVSLMGGESIAYSFGFLASIGVIGFYNLFGAYNSMWQALILCATTMALVWYLAYVERFKYAYSVIPVAAQLVIARLLWPSVSIFDDYTLADARTLLPAAASVVGLIVYSYFNGTMSTKDKNKNKRYELEFALAMMYVSPFYLFILGQQTWSMALGLIIAGLTTLHFAKHESIAFKEVAGFVTTAGLLWLLANQGVTNPLVHTHIIALLLALYAYIRDYIKDLEASNSYSLLSVGTLTIPLVLAALAQGGFYSLLLLCEMSGLFIFGLSVNRRHIYRTGLYTAVGALAYQLRSYGYAVVALIAIVVIGFAIHSAIKQDKSKDS